MHRFESPWDRALRLTTAAFVLLVLAAGAAAAAAFAGRDAELATLPIGVALLLVAVAWATAPRRFSVGGGALRIERNLWRPVVVPLARVETVGLLPPGATARSQKVIGSGGAFGHHGRYRSPALGSYRLFATRRERLVGVGTADAIYVLSPDRPDAFVNAILGAAPRAVEGSPGALSAGAETEAEAEGQGRGRGRAAVLLALVPVLVTILGVLAAWAAAPTSIAVHEDAIRIERRMLPARTVPLAEALGAEPLPPGRLAGARRVSGTAAGEAAYGTFEAPALGRFELAAYRRGPYVLVRRAERPLVVTPDDPEAFVAAVNAGVGPRR